jgi:hypothetical protein
MTDLGVHDEPIEAFTMTEMRSKHRSRKKKHRPAASIANMVAAGQEPSFG